MTIIALVLAALVQDQIDNPEYKGWATFKPGSSVTYKITTGVKDSEQKVTLKSVADNEIVVEMDMSMGGQVVTKAFERKIPAKVPASKAGKNVKEGEAEIEAGGKKLKCRTKEFEVTTANGKNVLMKVWINEEIPGLAARTDVTVEGTPTNSMVATAWEKK